MRNTKHLRKEGAALIMAVVAVFLISLLAMGSLMAAGAGSHMSGHRRDTQQAFDIAEAGFSHAYRSIADNGAYSGQSNVPFGGGWFTTVAKAGSAPGTIQVVSTGTVLGGEGIYATRTISGLVVMGGLKSLLGYAVVAKGPISMSGSVGISSSPNGGEGDVFSNSNVSLSGSVSVKGSISAVGKVTTSGKAGATGGINQGATPVTFPSVDSASLEKQAALNGTTNGNVSIASGTKRTLSGVINGNVTSSGSGSIILNGVVFVTGNVTLSGNSYSGNGTLIVLGTVTISGSSGLKTPDTSQLAIVDLSSSSNAVTLSGGASVGGLLYCPNGTVTISGGASVFGGVATNSITFSGSASVTRNTSQQPPTGIGGASIGYWYDETGS